MHLSRRELLERCAAFGAITLATDGKTLTISQVE
jgi:hypothetical protein